ncbi:MAG: hypothetical protein JSR17_13935 [Proteobacteria bacterium]|nr:hypothetical protein [Pseudomonadota bacterium]
MSLPGPTIERINNLIESKDFTALRKALKGYNDASLQMALQIKELVFKKLMASCWLTFLENKQLSEALEYRDLIDIVKRAYDSLQKDIISVAARKNLEGMLVTIASNPAWCRMLSYRFFLDYLPFCPALTEFIVYDEDFIKHLDFVHIDVLMRFLSDEQMVAILEYLDELLQNPKSPQHAWAKIVLKHLFKCNDKVRLMIINSEILSYSNQWLKQEFFQDKELALAVLKMPQFCHQWLGIGLEQPYMHPLFEKDEYKALIDALMAGHPGLAFEYINMRIKEMECLLLLMKHQITEVRSSVVQAESSSMVIAFRGQPQDRMQEDHQVTEDREPSVHFQPHQS